MPRTTVKPMVLGVTGTGTITPKATHALLNDLTEDRETELILHRNDSTAYVILHAWAKEWDLRIIEVDTVEGVFKELAHFKQDSDVRLLLAWNPEDEDCHLALEEALAAGIEPLDLTEGLEPLSFTDTVAAEEEQPTAEPQYELPETAGPRQRLISTGAGELDINALNLDGIDPELREEKSIRKLRDEVEERSPWTRRLIGKLTAEDCLNLLFPTDEEKGEEETVHEAQAVDPANIVTSTTALGGLTTTTLVINLDVTDLANAVAQKVLAQLR